MTQQAILFADPQVGWDSTGATATPYRYDGKTRAKAIYSKMGQMWPTSTWGACIGDVIGRDTTHYPPSDYSFLNVKEDWDKYLPFGVGQMCVTSGNHDWDYAIGDPALYGSQKSYEDVFGSRYYGRIRGNIAIFVIGDRNAGGDGECPPEAVETAIKFFQRNKEKLCIFMTHQPAADSLSNSEGVFSFTSKIRNAVSSGKIKLHLWFSGHVSHVSSGGLANPSVVSEIQDSQGIWHANVGMHLNRWEENGDTYSTTWGILDINPDVGTGTTVVQFRRFHYQANDYIPSKSFSFIFPRIIRPQPQWDYDGVVQFDSAVDYLRGVQTISAEIARDSSDTSIAQLTTWLLTLKLANTMGINLQSDVGTGILFKGPGSDTLDQEQSGAVAAMIARRTQATDSAFSGAIDFLASNGGENVSDLVTGLTVRRDSLRLGGDSGVRLLWGNGAPVAGSEPSSSLYFRLDGNSNDTRVYVKSGSVWKALFS